jgi:hypothetical protein
MSRHREKLPKSWTSASTPNQPPSKCFCVNSLKKSRGLNPATLTALLGREGIMVSSHLLSKNEDQKLLTTTLIRCLESLKPDCAHIWTHQTVTIQVAVLVVCMCLSIFPHSLLLHCVTLVSGPLQFIKHRCVYLNNPFLSTKLMQLTTNCFKCCN